MWLKSYTPRHKRLASLLWWDAMETPGIMRQRDGSRLACFSLESPDLDSALDLELVVQASQLNNLFRRYRKGWGFQTEERRRRVTEYPHPEELDELGKLLYDERVAQWAEGTHLTNDVYLTVVQKPQTDVIKGWRGMVYENLPEVDPAEYSLQEFEEELQRLQGMLKGASIQTTPLEESDLLTYLHSTISAKEHRVLMPEPACYLNTYLTDMDFDPGLYPKLSDGLRTRYFGCVSPHGWTKHTHPGMFDILAELPIEYRACVRNITMDRAEAIKQAEKDAIGGRASRPKGADSLGGQPAARSPIGQRGTGRTVRRKPGARSSMGRLATGKRPIRSWSGMRPLPGCNARFNWSRIRSTTPA
jgi:type IV secretion system protein VirB4